jgi:hypothetical protein
LDLTISEQLGEQSSQIRFSTFDFRAFLFLFLRVLFFPFITLLGALKLGLQIHSSRQGHMGSTCHFLLGGHIHRSNRLNYGLRGRSTADTLLYAGWMEKTHPEETRQRTIVGGTTLYWMEGLVGEERMDNMWEGHGRRHKEGSHAGPMGLIGGAAPWKGSQQEGGGCGARRPGDLR